MCVGGGGEHRHTIVVVISRSRNAQPRPPPFPSSCRHAPLSNSLLGFHFRAARYPEFVEAWALWLDNHPAVQAYLDPHYVILHPAGHQAVAGGVQQVLATLPAAPSGVQPASVQVNVGAAAGAAQHTMGNTIEVGSAHEAMAVAFALRSQYNNPLGGGGPGEAMYIASVRATQPLTFW